MLNLYQKINTIKSIALYLSIIDTFTDKSGVYFVYFSLNINSVFYKEYSGLINILKNNYHKYKEKIREIKMKLKFTNSIYC